VDCQQTRLIMTEFEEFAKPIGSPGRLEFSDIKPTQQTLEKWLVDPTLVSHHQETENRADRLTSNYMGTLSCVERATQWRGLLSFDSFESMSKTILDHAHVLLVYVFSRQNCSWKQLVTFELVLNEKPQLILHFAPM